MTQLPFDLTNEPTYNTKRYELLTDLILYFSGELKLLQLKVRTVPLFSEHQTSFILLSAGGDVLIESYNPPAAYTLPN